jgi:hypothetical protein
MENIFKKFYSIGENVIPDTSKKQVYTKFFQNDEEIPPIGLGGIVPPFIKQDEEFYKRRFHKDLFHNTKVPPENNPSFDRLLFTKPIRDKPQDVANAMKIQIMEEKLKHLDGKKSKKGIDKGGKGHQGLNMTKNSDDFYYEKGNDMMRMMISLKDELLFRLTDEGTSNRKIVNELTCGIDMVKLDMIDLTSGLELQRKKQEETLQWLIDEKNSRRNRNQAKRVRSNISC